MKLDVKTMKKGAKGLKLAPQTPQMPRLWTPTGEHRLMPACQILPTNDGKGVYVEGKKGERINNGRRHVAVQTLDVDTVEDVITAVMKPNDVVTEEQLQSLVADFGVNARKNYDVAKAGGFSQLHFVQLANEVEEDEEGDDY